MAPALDAVGADMGDLDVCWCGLHASELLHIVSIRTADDARRFRLLAIHLVVLVGAGNSARALGVDEDTNRKKQLAARFIASCSHKSWSQNDPYCDWPCLCVASLGSSYGQAFFVRAHDH